MEQTRCLCCTCDLGVARFENVNISIYNMMKSNIIHYLVILQLQNHLTRDRTVDSRETNLKVSWNVKF